MYVCREKNLAFLAHPHTASRSIKTALEERGFKQARGHHEGPPDLDPRWNLDYFCVVRNHFDAFTSWYISKGGSHLPHTLTDYWISGWVERHIRRKPPAYCRPHKLWYFLVDLPPRGFKIRWIKFEGIEKNINSLLSEYDIGPVTLPHISDKRRKGSRYQNVLHRSGKEFIETYFAGELADLDYKYEPRNEPVEIPEMTEDEIIRSLAKWII